jgi:dihydrofolate reductase
MNRVTLIVAATTNNGIGQAGKLPWRLPREMQYFARVTTGQGGGGKKNAVVMGRTTWESIPRRFRPLPGRTNFVISQQAEYSLCVGEFPLHGAADGAFSVRTSRGVTSAGTVADKNKEQDEDNASDAAEAVLASSLDGALEGANAADANRIFVIGGARLYAAALPLAERVLLTRIIEPSFEGCDVFMSEG